MTTMTLDQALALAMEHHRAGQLAQAESIYRQVLLGHPDHPDALHLLGVLAYQTGQSQRAVELIRRAIQFNAGSPQYHCNLGQALYSLGRADEAIEVLNLALALRPDYAEARNNLGNALAAAGRLDEAIAAYRQGLASNSQHAQAWNNLGSALQTRGQLNEAIAAHHQALAIQADFPEALNNLGNALLASGRTAEAIATYRRAVTVSPGFPQALANLGNALKQQGDPDSALESYQQAVSAAPQSADAHCNLAILLSDQGQHEESIGHFHQALNFQHDHAACHSNLILTMSYHSGCDPDSILVEARAWDRQHAAPLSATIRRHVNDRDPSRPLRIGYVSPDFRDHPIGRMMLPVLANHDRREYQTVAYASVRGTDELTAKLRDHVAEWRDVASQSDAELAETIRRDRIDILVDLAVHSAGNRLVAFGRKPAPVQVTWLGYPGTTGLSTIDYRFTDPYLDPPDSNDSHYSERSIRLPHTFWCYDPSTVEVPANNLPALTNGFVTFGCLNNPCKINDFTLSLWAQVLEAVPDSRFLLLGPRGSWRQRVLQKLRVGADRVEFVDRQPRVKYLELYHRIDVGLDTFPYNGHTTSLDGLCMGVPTVSLAGQTAVSRAGFSQASNLGLASELMATDTAQFTHLAVELAGSVPRLRELRANLRQKIQDSPLMDPKAMAQSLEAAYRDIWRRWCSGDDAST